MPSPTPSVTSRQSLALLVSLLFLVVLMPATNAAAQQAEPRAHMAGPFFWFPDEPPDGPNCGELLNFIVGLGGNNQVADLHDTILEIPIPPGTEIAHDVDTPSANASDQHPDEPPSSPVFLSGLTPGDRTIRIDYGTVCVHQSHCIPVGATAQVVLRITGEGTSTSSFSLQGSLSGSNFDPIATDWLGDNLPASPAVIEYEPCPLSPPPPSPPRLDATLRDELVVDSDNDGVVDAGDTVRYHAEITNIRTETATGVAFRSFPPEGSSLVIGSVAAPAGATVTFGNAAGDTVVVVNLGSLDGGESRALSFDAVIDGPVAAGQTELSCQGRVFGSNTSPLQILTDDPDTFPEDDPTVTPLDFEPDLAITKEPTPASVAAGELLLWGLDVGNLGRSASGAVTLTETVPPHTTFSAADSTTGWSCAEGAGPGTACTLSLPPLASGQASAAEFAVRVDDALPAGAESTTNTATVNDDGSQGPDPVPGNNTATATATLAAAPALTVSKTGPASARPGDTIAYQIIYANTGTQEATGVELRETVPEHTTFVAGASTPGWSCADGSPAGTPCTLSRSSVAAGASATVAFAVRLSTTVPADLTVVTNRVSIHRDPGDDPPDDPDPDDETETPVDAAVDLRITKTGPPSTSAGATVVYDLALANTGDRDAAGVTVLESVPAPTVFDAAASSAGWDCADGAPAGTPCTLLLGDLPAGATASATFAVRLPATIPAGLEALTNLATVTSDTPDADPSDNDARATTAILAAPDLAVTKTDHDAVVQPGGALPYTLTVANLGDQDATNVTVADTLPPGTAFEARASTDGWSCDAATPQVCVFTLPALAAGAPPLELTLAVSAAPDLPPDVTELVNLAAVSDDGTGGDDPNPEDNTATETTPVARDDGPPPPPDRGALAATLTDNLLLDVDEDGLADPGDIVTYVALVESRGPADAHAVRLTIPLDPHTTLIPGSVTTTRGEVIGASGQVTDRLQVALGDLPVETSATVTFEVDVGEIPPGTDHLSAQGTLTADNTAGTPTDDPDTPAPLDPTLTPVGDAAGPPPPRVEDIPTLAQWGLILLALGLTSLALRRLRPVEERTP